MMTTQQLLRLSVRHPVPEVCVVRVNGDLDMAHRATAR